MKPLARLFDCADLPDQIRGVLRAAESTAGGHHIPLTGSEIFERLPCRNALLAECARRTDAIDAYELAAKLIGDALIRQLGSEIRFDVVEGNGLAIDLGDAMITTSTGLVIVYRLTDASSQIENRF